MKKNKDFKEKGLSRRQITVYTSISWCKMTFSAVQYNLTISTRSHFISKHNLLTLCLSLQIHISVLTHYKQHEAQRHKGLSSV